MSADRFKERLAKMGLDAAPFSEEDLAKKYENRKHGIVDAQPMAQMDSFNADRGVVFLSTVPLDMRPTEVRLYFNEYGPILRQKFVPYPKKLTPNGKTFKALQFKEGYFEFEHKKDAEKAVLGLNGKAVGVKRFRKAHGQTWNCKVLHDFSWDTLLEKKEKELRELKHKEHRAKEEERQINEAFRKMVAMKKQRGDLLAKSREKFDDRMAQREADGGVAQGADTSAAVEDEAATSPATTTKRDPLKGGKLSSAKTKGAATGSPTTAERAKKILALRQKRARDE